MTVAEAPARRRRRSFEVYIVAVVVAAVLSALLVGDLLPARGDAIAVCVLAFALLLYGGQLRAQSASPPEAEPAPALPAPGRTLLEHAFHAVLDPIMVIDELGIVLAANPATERVFGWPAADIVGHNVKLIMGEPYRSEHDGYVRNYLRTGERRAIGKIRKVIGRRRDGSEFPCELSVSEVHTDASRRFFGVVRDVSEREHFAMRMAAAERLAAVGEAAAGIAHEVNNPVNTIINCAQMIKDGDTAPELCDHVIQEGVRIAGFVRELMNVASDREEDYCRLDVREPLRRALALLAVRLRHAGIHVSVEAGDGLPQVRARPHRLQQVFLNVLLNALDALRDLPRRDKRVDVSTRAVAVDGKPFVAVTVRDNGPGVPEYARERVFQPFFTTKKPGEGTGLGLAVSSTIVRDHGGRIELRSEVGQFAEFTVWLPAAAG
jgi:two-component system sensor kinase FixL